MKSAYYPILRIVLTLIVGVFMIIFPNKVLSYIALLLGLLLLIPGTTQLLRYIIVYCKRNRRDRRYNPMTFPYLATACVVAGVAIIVFSSEIVKIFAFLLASALIFAGIYEIAMIVKSIRKNSIGYYIMPVFLILLGAFILLNPLDFLPKATVTLFGIGAIIYSINEILYMARIDRQ